MADSDYVDVEISLTAAGVTAPGFSIPLIPSYSATWPERTRLYSSLSGVAGDFADTTSPEYRAAEAIFDQNPAPSQIMIGRCANKPTKILALSVTAAANTRYPLNVRGQGITDITVSYTTLASLTLGTRSTNDITITAHGMTNGDGPYLLSGGTPPTGLAANTLYWIHVIDANTIEFSTSKANALAGTPISLSGDGSGTVLLDRSSNDVIIAQLVQALNGVASANYTAASTGSNGSKTMTITGSAAGDWFSVESASATIISITETTADAGIAADLTAILNESKAWYCLGNYYNSAAIVTAIATWTEANKLLFIAQSQDTTSITTEPGNGDAIDAIKTGNYMRSAGLWHPLPSEFVDFAWMGAMLPKMVRGLGKWATWALEELASVTVNQLTDTQRANLCGVDGVGGRHATVYELAFGTPVTSNTAQVGNGNFIDSTIGLDAIRIDVTTSVFDLLIQSAQVPFTDPGIAGVGAKIRAALKRAENDQILVDGSSAVTVPAAANVSPSDKAIRKLTGVTFTGERAGAIQGATINGFLS